MEPLQNSPCDLGEIENLFLALQMSEFEGKETGISFLDIFIFGFTIGSSAALKPKSIIPKKKVEALWEKIKTLGNLSVEKIITNRQKLNIYTDVLSSEADKFERRFDDGVESLFFDVRKIDSVEEAKLSEIEIMKVQTQEERLKESYRLQKEHDDYAKIECPVCLTKLVGEEYWSMRNCGHCFHDDCLEKYLLGEIQSRKFPIICPFEKCGKDISADDISEIVEEENLNKYWDYTLQSYIDLHSDEMSWCPSPDCKYAFSYAEGLDLFSCPICKKEYCLKCRGDSHKSMTCEENMKIKDPDFLNEKFLGFVRGMNFKQCPNCKFWVEKSVGCDHMRCRCGFEFCYKCGGVYLRCECVQQANRLVQPVQPVRPVQPIQVIGNPNNPRRRHKNKNKNK